MEAKEEQEKRETELKQATITMQAAPQSFLTFQGGRKSLYII